jgi:nitrate/TMAO reductase-like tetraheme cytochrome c subunit
MTVIILIASIYSAEYYTSQPSFCGSCHIMKKYYNSWKSSKHGGKDVACIECHYPPGEKRTLKAKFKGLGQLFTYLGTGSPTVRKPARVSDSSCTTSDCHADEELMDKKITFTKNISYVHNTHKDKTIEGQTLHCDTCHQHIRSDKHFEVNKEACYLCHFKEAKFNEGRAKCSLCHEIPTISLQKQKIEDTDADEEPITHKSLEEAKVPCQSCHYELVQGSGEVKQENCSDCHEYSDELQKNAQDKRSMHTEHVTKQNAKCFECHRPVLHRKVEFLNPVREACMNCHPDHHRYQNLLLIGDKRKDVMESPGLMYDVKTNCIGCHLDEKTINGEKVLFGSSKSCVSCHTAKYETTVTEWRNKIKEELDYARALETNTIKALETTKDGVKKKKVEQAKAMLEVGQENLRIVEFGDGVHNMKYAVILLDTAMNNFENALNLLGKK